jgi:hypothetical protein
MNQVKFTFVFNVRINNEERFHRLISVVNCIPKIHSLNFSIRVRGNLKNVDFHLKHPSFLYFGSTWNEWNLDVIEQVVAIPSDYYILMQEDHLLKMSWENFTNLLNEIEASSVDYMPLSFHPHYEAFVEDLNRIFPLNRPKKGLSIWDLDKQNYLRSNLKNRNYPLNLIGVYKKELLLRLLIRSRPFYKQYSIQTPFNFERSPNESWFLPIRWAYPSSEVFACVDDDHGIQGYSLMSRGEYESNIERVVEHHDLNSLSSLKKFHWLIRFLVNRLPTKIQVLPRNLKYSFEFFLNIRKRRNIVKKLLSGI